MQYRTENACQQQYNYEILIDLVSNIGGQALCNEKLERWLKWIVFGLYLWNAAYGWDFYCFFFLQMHRLHQLRIQMLCGKHFSFVCSKHVQTKVYPFKYNRLYANNMDASFIQFKNSSNHPVVLIAAWIHALPLARLGIKFDKMPIPWGCLVMHIEIQSVNTQHIAVHIIYYEMRISFNSLPTICNFAITHLLLSQIF